MKGFLAILIRLSRWLNKNKYFFPEGKVFIFSQWQYLSRIPQCFHICKPILLKMGNTFDFYWDFNGHLSFSPHKVVSNPCFFYNEHTSPKCNSSHIHMPRISFMDAYGHSWSLLPLTFPYDLWPWPEQGRQASPYSYSGQNNRPI